MAGVVIIVTEVVAVNALHGPGVVYVIVYVLLEVLLDGVIAPVVEDIVKPEGDAEYVPPAVPVRVTD